MSAQATPPPGPALVVLASDRRHYLRAEEAVLRGGFLLARQAGRWRAYPPAAVSKVVWLEASEEAVA